VQEGHAPDHVADGGGQEQQSGREAAQVGLRIGQYDLVRFEHRENGRGPRRPYVVPGRRQQPYDQRDHRERDAGEDPEMLPGDAAVDERSDRKLANRSAEHAKALGESDGGGEIAGRKAMRREIDGTGESERGAGALQQTAGLGGSG